MWKLSSNDAEPRFSEVGNGMEVFGEEVAHKTNPSPNLFTENVMNGGAL